jgi:hypothetical protein
LLLAACGGEDAPSVSSSSAASAPAAQSPAPPAPNSPTPQPTSSLRLEWNANTEPDLAGYKIYGARSSGAYGAAVATVPKNATSFLATGLQPGGTYFFVITAFDTAGNESVRSVEVSAVAPM